MRKLLFIAILIGSPVFLPAQTTLDTAADFSAKDIRGIMHYLYQTLDSNNFVLLDFFTTTCGPCVTYAPEIQQAYVHFGSNQANVRFWGINYADDNLGVAIFDSLYGIEFPTISGLSGHGNTVALSVFNIQSFPTMVFIAPNHLILNKQISPPSFHMLDSTLTASIGTYTGFSENLKNNLGFKMNGVFPNPVLNEAVIQFETSESVQGSLQILSVSGVIIKTLPNITLLAGQQNYTFNAAFLNPGIYFVRFFNHSITSDFCKVIVQ